MRRLPPPIRAQASPSASTSPSLLRWVHVTEVESFLDTAKRAGVALTESDVDGYYTEQRRAAALVGLEPAVGAGHGSRGRGLLRSNTAGARHDR